MVAFDPLHKFTVYFDKKYNILQIREIWITLHPDPEPKCPHHFDTYEEAKIYAEKIRSKQIEKLQKQIDELRKIDIN